MSLEDVLTTLADGEFHSTQNLAESHGLSSATIDEELGQLGAMGLYIEQTQDRRYRIPGGLDLLSDLQIRDQLGPGSQQLLGEIHIHWQIDSTNAELLRKSSTASGVHVCLAEHQSAGRGRRGRHWVSPFASSVYCSVACPFEGGAQSLGGLSLAVGVIVCDALESMGVQDLGLKWPNDVYCGGKKLAGVLIELQGDLAGTVTAIIGVGVNVRLPSIAADTIEQAWTDLSTVAEPVSRNVLVGRYLNRLLPALDAYGRDGFADWRERWQELDIYADQPVVIHSGDRRITGTARGVDENGALLLETAAGVSSFHGGEVSLRPVL